MSPLQAFRVYNHVKLHFSSDKYDVRHYEIRELSRGAFDKSKNKYKLSRLAQKYTSPQLIEFFIANFVSGDKYGGMYSDHSHEVYLDWQSRVQGLTYYYTQDILHLKERGYKTADQLWVGDDHPLLLKEYLGKRISLETMVILDKLYNYRLIVDQRLTDDFIWKPISRLMYKYEPFLTFSKEDFQTVTQKVFDAI